MEKFCIFCGKKPRSKNREHIIPQWLINLTGDPNREVYLGRKWTTPNLEKRMYSFKSFTFPSCKNCNDAFAAIEAQAKPIVEGILSRIPLSANQWDAFFDWLDKVRTGLWLGMIYLNENYRFLLPMFHINRRVASKDRFTIVYEIIDDGDTGVGWAATETPLFQHMPSVFTLTINNFLFFNASYDFLFSQRFGFPYPSKREFRSDGGQWIEMAEGTALSKFPLLDKEFKTGGTQLFQPMIPYDHFRNENGERADIKELYDNDYVRANCMDFKAGRGYIFRRDRNQLVKYQTRPSLEWLPKQRFPRGEVSHKTGVLAGELLEQLFCNHPSFDNLTKEERDQRNSEIEGARRLHKTIMNHYIGQKDMFY